MDLRNRVEGDFLAENVLKGINFHLEKMGSQTKLKIKEVSRLENHTLNPSLKCITDQEYYFDVKSMASARTYGYRIYCNAEIGLKIMTDCKLKSMHDMLRKNSNDTYKLYKCNISTENYYGSPFGSIFNDDLAWSIPMDLDIQAMKEASMYLIGEVAG